MIQQSIKKKILIIEDDRSIQKMLTVALRAKDYDCKEAMTVKDGIAETAIYQPDLILLDLQLPDGSGLEIVKTVRNWTWVPIIVLSVINREEDKIALLDSGADDYVTKPFSMGELLARIRTSLRNRLENSVCANWEDENLKIDIGSRTITNENQKIHLTPTEFQILEFLILNAGKIITYEKMIQIIWGESAQNEMSSLRVHMTQLRKKIENKKNEKEYITTIPGIGYMWKSL